MDILTIAATLSIVIIATPLIWWWYILRKFKVLERIPGPIPLPLVGNAIAFGQTPQSVFANALKFCRRYGRIYKVFIGPDAKVFISDPDMMEKILSSNVHITKSNAYDLLEPWLGEGLLISTGNKWKIRRKMITPTFHFKILDQFMEVFNSCANVLVEKLSKEVGKDSVDVSPYIDLATLDVICETAMGVKVRALEGQNTKYVAAGQGYLNIFTERLFSAWEKSPFLFRLSPLYPAYKRHLTTVHSFTDNIILRRREQKTREESSQRTESDDGIKRRIALLDMLLESDLSNEDIRAEIDTFMFEGHDTTYAGISFLLLILAEHQDVQEKLYEEIISVTPEKTEYVKIKHVQDMKYLDMVVKEAQRLYPSVPFVERRITTEANIGGYDFAKDTILTLYFYGMFHNEEIFPEPQKFDPLRFLPENVLKMHNFAYVPFSAGARNCIGQRFALLEIKTTIIKILQNFKILPVPGFKPDLGMAAILKSYNGIYVKLEPRN